MTGDARPGTVIDDRFRLEERIDTGGLATVWRASDRERERPVALKCEPDGASERERVRAHFRGELRWFRRFEGGPVPGSLVRFIDGSVGEGTAYIATELIGGGSVADRFDREDRDSSLEAIREIGGPVCRTLAFLHHNGVVHLDLKPSNVLVRHTGRPAVIDLNAAVSTEAEPDVRFGTDPFKAPELTRPDASEAPIGPRADVYALGAFLSALLTGSATAASSVTRAVTELRAHDAEPPAALAALVRRATAPDPHDRFDDAGDLYDALVPVLEASEQTARLVHDPSGRAVRVRPGDTVGRWAVDRRVPTIVLPDEEQFLDPDHAVLEHDGTAWHLRDRSLNGTYVRRDADWEYLLSRDGRKRRRSADAPLPRPEPPTSTRLSDGDRIAPVSPDYGCRLTFRTER
ncbi:protein kinase domain-containing protein [Natrinema sp. 74]|uniref:serine/threonine-protein kinase n=1 Tax=Natrinema sp. 74 TaxID=3384159 RepID=UPI0038D4AE0E